MISPTTTSVTQFILLEVNSFKVKPSCTYYDGKWNQNKASSFFSPWYMVIQPFQSIHIWTKFFKREMTKQFHMHTVLTDLEIYSLEQTKSH